MPLDLRELYRVKSLRYDPSNPVTELLWKDPRKSVKFHLGKVINAKDPDGLGRVKVEMKIFADNALTDWCPVARPFGGSEMGFFSVPEVDTMVVLAFVNSNINFPVVLGPIYGQPRSVIPPLRSNPDNDLKKFTSKSGMEIVLNDKSGEEQIVIRTKDGKMELNLTKAGGITLKNELGDVVIDCDTFFMETSKDAVIKSEKSASFEAESLELKSSKGVTVKSSGNVIVKGSKIKLKGTGCTAENKQIAVKQDMIFGIDNHQVKIPTQSGPQPGPVLPHPFIGDLKDDLSKDVLINNKAVAMKGSKGKTKVHMQMPPGIMFVKAPDKIGIVDKNCIDSVKVNGKAVAVLMAECKTCNDPGPTAMVPAKVLAFGTAINLPASLLGLDPNLYRSTNGNVRINTRDMMAGAGAGNNGNRNVSNPMWSKTACSFGEKVKLSVDIQSYPNAAVTFTIWKEGADQQTETPITTLRATSANAKAEVEWAYTYVPDEQNPLTAKPKFIFTADSHDCERVQSSSASEWGAKIDMTLKEADGVPLKGLPYKLSISGEEGRLDDNGRVLKESVIPGEKVTFNLTSSDAGGGSGQENNTQQNNNQNNVNNNNNTIPPNPEPGNDNSYSHFASKEFRRPWESGMYIIYFNFDYPKMASHSNPDEAHMLNPAVDINQSKTPLQKWIDINTALAQHLSSKSDLVKNSKFEASIECYASFEGSDDYNKHLTMRRGNALKKWVDIKYADVDITSNVVVTGHGEVKDDGHQPDESSGTTPSGEVREKDRRAELSFRVELNFTVAYHFMNDKIMLQVDGSGNIAPSKEIVDIYKRTRRITGDYDKYPALCLAELVNCIKDAKELWQQLKNREVPHNISDLELAERKRDLDDYQAFFEAARKKRLDDAKKVR